MRLILHSYSQSAGFALTYNHNIILKSEHQGNQSIEHKMSKYSLVSQRSSFEDGSVYVITASLSHLCSKSFPLDELLRKILDPDSKSFALLDFILPSGFRSKPYIVRALSAPGLSVSQTVEDIEGYVFDRVALGGSTIVVVCSGSSTLEQDASAGFIIIFQHCEKESDSLVNLSYSQRMALTDWVSNTKRNSWKEGKAWRVIISSSLFRILCGSFVLVSVVALTFVLSSLFARDQVTSPNTVDRISSTTVSRLDSFNISQWLSEHSGGRDFAYRSDDQFLVPTKLFSSTDLRYNEWFESTYPALRNISSEKRYLEPSFLAGDHETLLVDHRFHVAHCVAALRRSWAGIRNGGEMCRQGELDKHTEHCFGLLDDWILVPEGQQPENRRVKVKFWLDVCDFVDQ